MDEPLSPEEAEHLRHSVTPVLRLVNITPSLAEHWLVGHQNFRTRNTNNEQNIANDIRAGRWVINGDSIKWNCNGNLIDGQTRLNAIIESWTPVVTYVAFGMPDAAVGTIDNGRKRTLAQWLAYRKEEMPRVLAHAIILAYQYETTTVGKHQNISFPTAERWLIDNPGIREAVKISKTGDLRGLPRYALAVLYYFTQQKGTSEEEVLEFSDQLCTGTNLPIGHPVLAFRDLVHSWLTVRVGHKHDIEIKFACLINAWNKFLLAQSVPSKASLRWGNRKAQQFPVILGQSDRVRPLERGVSYGTR